jgi:hypothetical protein
MRAVEAPVLAINVTMQQPDALAGGDENNGVGGHARHS